MSILGIEKLYILCIDNTYTYDVEKILINKGKFLTLSNSINVFIHNNHSFEIFMIKY